MTDSLALHIDSSDILADAVEAPSAPPRRPSTPARTVRGQPIRIGDYHITSRFPSGMLDGVFLGYKRSRLGFVHQAVLKWVRRASPDYAEAKETLIDEARALSALHHPHVVGLLDADEVDDGAFIALEYVPGTDLRLVAHELMRRGQRMPFSLACFVTVDVLHGLQHAHDAVDPEGRPLQLVHRDVNPANILLSRGGLVKLTDFGIARMTKRSQRDTAPGIVKGKFRYMAPEYVRGGPFTKSADIYAAGICLYELLAGTTAFADGERLEIFRAILSDGLDLDLLEQRSVPGELVQIVGRATAPAPQERFATAAQMAHGLERWLADCGDYVSASVLGAYLQKQGLI